MGRFFDSAPSLDPPPPSIDATPPGPLPAGRALAEASPLLPCTHAHCLELPMGTDIHPLGMGRCALVYNASYWGCPSAAKVVQDGDGHADAQAWLNHELRVLPQLTHTNIVAFRHYAHLTYHGVHALVMELMVGGNLQAVVERLDAAGTALRADVFLNIALQVTCGLEYLHAQGLVHADIKPENILLSAPPSDRPDGTVVLPPGTAVKLCDFGVALRFADDDEVHSRGYTPGFLAPECAAGGGADGGGARRPPARPAPSRDMYALGVVLHELLVSGGGGERSFVSRTRVADEPDGQPQGLPSLPPRHHWPSLGVGGGGSSGPSPPVPARARLCEKLPTAVRLTRALLTPDAAARPTAHRLRTALAELYHREAAAVQRADATVERVAADADAAAGAAMAAAGAATAAAVAARTAAGGRGHGAGDAVSPLRTATDSQGSWPFGGGASPMLPPAARGRAPCGHPTTVRFVHKPPGGERA